MRRILIGGGVIVVAVAGATIFLLSSLDGIVKDLIENVGSAVAGAKVSVGSVHISLENGSGTIRGFTLANPPGYSGHSAISLGDITLTLDKASVTGNPVVIRELQIDAPAITYEWGGNGSNLEQIKKNIQSYSAAKGGKSGGSSAASNKKLVIDHLSIRQGQVTVAANGIAGAEASAKLGDISLNGIGRSSGGVDQAQLAEQLLRVLLNSATESALSLPGLSDKLKGLVPPEASGLLKELIGH
jgi:hypothetical protein